MELRRRRRRRRRRRNMVKLVVTVIQNGKRIQQTDKQTNSSIRIQNLKCRLVTKSVHPEWNLLADGQTDIRAYV
jgi:hypothetical protein